MDRFYQEAPEKKTVEQCYSHGQDHAAYGWTKGIDPRWNEAQREAYLNGYNGSKKER